MLNWAAAILCCGRTRPAREIQTSAKKSGAASGAAQARHRSDELSKNMPVLSCVLRSNTISERAAAPAGAWSGLARITALPLMGAFPLSTEAVRSAAFSCIREACEELLAPSTIAMFLFFSEAMCGPGRAKGLAMGPDWSISIVPEVFADGRATNLGSNPQAICQWNVRMR